jgi:hypothetical protein
MSILGSSGVTLFNNFWVQMGAYLAAYIAFNGFIFGPIRNYRPMQANPPGAPKK